MSENGYSIKQWKEEDRPREKLALQGKQNLKDAELLAILIGSGTREKSAVELCAEILEYANNDLSQLGKLSIIDLQKFKGIGEAKAITIVAALELGRRRQAENIQELKKVTCSKDIYRLFINYLSDLPYEEFWVLYLNQGNKVIGKEKISTGGISGTVADVRLILKKALDRLAVSIVLVHNHPSGNLTPSQADKNITQKIQEAGKILDIIVIDHLIISDRGFYSFADEGEM